MNGTGAVLQEEYFEHFVTPDIQHFNEDSKGDIAVHTALELLVTDSITGKPISNAMISIDSLSITAVCDENGKAFIENVLSGDFVLDVIVWGYSANSTKAMLSARNLNTLQIEMVRNC